MCLLVIQWTFCLGILPINVLFLNQFNPLHYSFLTFSPYTVLFNSFQCVSLSCSHTDVMYFIITHPVSFFPSFPPPLVSYSSPTFGSMFCIYLYVYMIMLVVVLDLSSIHERKHEAFVFLNLAYFTSFPTAF
jgi:hypothetical protein